jgi:hypothetical protein
MTSLDEIVKECCKVCGIYHCKIHRDWSSCEVEGCVSSWDSNIYLGCPICLEKQGKPIYKPKLKEACYFCKDSIPDGSLAYTDGTPVGTFCLPCAVFRKIAFWTIKVRVGRVWTIEEIVAERKRASS